MTNVTLRRIFRSRIAQFVVAVGSLVVAIAVDGKVRQLTLALQVPIVISLMNGLTWLGDVRLLLIGTIALFALGGWFRRNTLKKVGGVGFLTLAISNVVVEILKHLIGRPRPGVIGAGGLLLGPSWESGYDSFPSGHTNSAFVMAAILSNLYPSWRRIWTIMAALVGFTRMYLDVHFVSDVLAGAFLGLMMTKFVLRFQRNDQIHQ
jgi:membrane-associated phospholipid phosphatase